VVRRKTGYIKTLKRRKPRGEDNNILWCILEEKQGKGNHRKMGRKVRGRKKTNQEGGPGKGLEKGNEGKKREEGGKKKGPKFQT